ncbi:MAG TPA: hypothetical protein VN726_03715 [Hanamia sp.]|nr:hypothetical protein [Hanamia sp.]
MNQTNEQPKTFLEILKEDPSRTKELLDAAESITTSGRDDFEGDDDMDDSEVTEARNKTDVTLDEPKWPVVAIPVKKMKNFIHNNTTGNDDVLIFYLASYKNQRQVDRYNRRNGTNYSLSDLIGRPTLLLDSLSNHNSNLVKLQLKDIGHICPPPRGECY